ncbi:MAG: DUF2332 domain-containing protein [Actinomycetota bacterium]|nr:DUF2332 domain-containing protein [Actinomycetota bacterium]
MYADLLDRAADDVERGGPTAAVLHGHEDDPGRSALPLRLMGTVHRLVLSGAVPELAEWYPSAGGSWRPAVGCPAFRQVLATRRDQIRSGLHQPPQTNEVGRSAALFGGLLFVADDTHLPVRLFEIGASGGLNLRADHYRYDDESGRAYGPQDSPVHLTRAWLGACPPVATQLRLAERHGSDVAPLDPTSRDGALTLMSYVWPDQQARLERLAGALAVARRVPAVVERCRAIDLVRRLAPAAGLTTVLWHSVTWQYLDRDEQAAVRDRIEELGAAATESAPFAHVYMEPQRRLPQSGLEFPVVLRLWPGGERRVLGVAAPHGVPTTWA